MDGLLPWIVGAAVLAWFVYGRVVGARAAAEAKVLLAQGARLVDVRSPAEYASGHLEGALNIPLGELPGRIGEIGAPTEPVVVYCRSGARSAMAARVLQGRGFARVVNLGAMSNG